MLLGTVLRFVYARNDITFCEVAADAPPTITRSRILKNRVNTSSPIKRSYPVVINLYSRQQIMIIALKISAIASISHRNQERNGPESPCR